MTFDQPYVDRPIQITQLPPSIRKPLAVLAFYPLTKTDVGSLGPKEAWEHHRKIKPDEVAFAEQVYQGEIMVSVPILG